MVDPGASPEEAFHDTLFGLDPSLEPGAAVLIIPAPFEATASHGRGTSHAPTRVVEASPQVDLYDPAFPDAWQAGIALQDADPRIAALDARASEAVARAVAAWEAGVPRAGRVADTAIVDDCTTQVADILAASVGAALDGGQVPGVLGGDHSVALGGLQAALSRVPNLGVLHIDAHADLRPAYQGFRHSHASILWNVLHGPVPPAVLVSVGLRDLCAQEAALAASHPAIHAHMDRDLARAAAQGVAWSAQVSRILAPLPRDVWITFDIDGLDPTLCPTTGTPVPGGLAWHDAVALLEAVAQRGHRVVGFDLTEVGDAAWDANVGARLLLKLATLAIHCRAREEAP